MRVGNTWIVVVCVLALSGLALSAPQTAVVTAVSGDVTVEPGGRTLGISGEVAEGDTVTLAPGARLTLTFADGATMDVTGPARFEMKQLDDRSRTIDLVYGTVNRFVAKDIVTGIRTPLDSFVAARNGTVFVGIGETPTKSSVTFMLLDGENAKVVDGGRIRVLTKAEPIVVDRQKEGPSAPAQPVTRDGESVDFQLGEHRISVTPKDAFTVIETPGGGIRLTNNGPGFGMVVLDDETAFYLYEGEFVEFDANGYVVDHDGVVHIYDPLNRRGIYDEPIESPASASFTGTRVK